MSGHIDGDFQSVNAVRTIESGDYVDGVWVDGSAIDKPHTVTIQPLNDKEIRSLGIGLERITDTRKIYVNDGDLFDITPENTWSFEGIEGVFKCIALDNRPWRNYCKIIVSRQDDE